MSGYLIVLILCAVCLILLARACFRYPAKSKQTKRFRILLILVLSGAILFCGLKEFGPRGLNSLFGHAGAGENLGEDTQEGQSGKAEPAVKDGLAVIIVSGDEVKSGSSVFRITEDGDEGLALFLAKEIGPEVSVRVIDSYAYAKAYKRVIEILRDLDIPYTELSE